MLIKSERGAVLAMVAVAMTGLLGFCVMVVDHGVMLVSRNQAQTAVDAAALAGIQSLAFDNAADPQVRARAVASTVGTLNTIFGQSAPIQPADITFPACPLTPGYPADPVCVQAAVVRNNLPVFFGPLIGVNTHGVKAVAVGRGISANSANCLKPWVVGDKWLDTQAGGWSQTAKYDPADGDVYTPPSADSAGTGFSDRDAAGVPTFHGYQIILKLANPGLGADDIPVHSSGFAMEVDLNNATTAGSTPAYNANITGCTSDTVTISPPNATCTAVDATVGCLKVKLGSTGANNAKSVADFIAAHDPSATWSGGWQTGGIVSAQPPSSRIVPIAIFSVPEYVGAGYSGANGIVRVVNIVGFFLEGTCNTVGNRESYLECPGGGKDQSAVVGRLVNYPGLNVGTGGSVMGAFGLILALVR